MMVWRFLERVGDHFYWTGVDEKGKAVYHCTLSDTAPSETAGGYYSLETLKMLKGDS